MKCIGKIVIVALLLSPILLRAQIDPSGSKTYGLIIGVADYTNNPKLDFADKDALEFYLYLLKASHSDTKKISVFLNQSATREKIAEKFRNIVNDVQAGDHVFIYFSGHGNTEQSYLSDNFFLLLSNASAKNYLTRPNDLLDKNFFDRYIQLLAAKKARIIFICDACHAGSLIGGETAKKNNNEAFMRSWKNEVKLLSCQPEQVSQESPQWGGGRSLFSFYLILGVEGLADKDGNGQVSLSELEEYLDHKVTEDAKIFNIPQQPEVIGEKAFIISQTRPELVTAARQQFQANSSSEEYHKLASTKGAKVTIGNNIFIYKSTIPGQEKAYIQTEPGEAIADNYLRAIYYSFKTKIEEGALLTPEDNSAYYYYRLFSDNKGDTIPSAEMRTTLITALINTYDQLLAPLYEADTAAFAAGLQTYDEKTLAAAATLAGDDLLTGSEQIKARSLFLTGCRHINDPADSQAIPLFEKAIAADSLCPAFYLKLGEAWTLKGSLNNAAENYQHYIQLLPNEEHGYDRLGLVLMAQGQYAPARDAFKKALEIEPSYPAAREHLRSVPSPSSP